MKRTMAMTAKADGNDEILEYDDYPGHILLYIHRPEVIFRQLSCAIVSPDLTFRKVQAKLDPTPITEKVSRDETFVKFEIDKTAFYTINMVNGQVHVEGDISYPFSGSVLQKKMEEWIVNKVKYDRSKETLRCIDKSRYATVYNDIKNKIGKHLVETWPECTDPEKYVYEDVAIATYLILLTDEENKHRQVKIEPKDITFLDAGCGNALFGWILAQQGYNYIGIDVVRRKIWDRWLESIPEGVNFILSEKPLTDLESFKSEFGNENINWIIGNHSDELTPWLSVLAKTLNCNFLLIPCCSFDFNGKKFDKQQPNFKDYSTSIHRPPCNSTHFQYLAYVKSIALELCGFDRFDEDILRIPSTKRHAFIGRNNIHNPESGKNSENNQKIENNEKSDNIKNPETAEKTKFPPSKPFKFKLDYTIAAPSGDDNPKLPSHDWREEIQNRVANHLLRNVPINNAESAPWNRGEVTTLKDIIKECALQDKLAEIKSVKGGLKALLLHNSQLFRVERAQLSIRNWPEDNSKRRKIQHLKTKNCWFHEFHSQGCPLSEQECCFRH